MASPGTVRADFERIVRLPESALDLARAALLVAAESDPAVDVDSEAARLDRWAAEFSRRIEPGWNNLQKLARLRAYVFEDLGFVGDHEDYYHPDNSLLHRVMQRRRGVPLTLSIVFMEIGWRTGMPFEGVGFPGHFLVRLSGEPGDLLLDPYREGRSVHEDDCRRMLLEVSGGRLPFTPGLTASVGKRDMVLRLLHNLKGAWLRVGDDAQALAAVERLLVMRPGDAGETRDRGLLLYRLQRYGLAMEALRDYLRRAPDAEDRDSVAAHLERVMRLAAEMN